MLALHAALWLSVAKLENWARLMQARAHEFSMTQALQGEGDSPSPIVPPIRTGSPTARQWVVHRQLPHYRRAQCPTCEGRIGSGILRVQLAGEQGARCPAWHLDCLLAHWRVGDCLLNVYHQPIWAHEYAEIAAR
eukprot:6257644-Prorocentrum_lima.AAC.1